MCAKKKNSDLTGGEVPGKAASVDKQRNNHPGNHEAEQNAFLKTENENINRELIGLKMAQEARFFLASIVESSKDSIVTVDFNNVITSWNKGAEFLYGYPAAEAIGRDLNMVTLPKDLAQILANIELIKYSKEVKRFETVRVHKNGQMMTLEIELSPVKNDAGAVIGVSTFARDITERKRRESNLAFLANINLDFATLLTVNQVMEQVGERLVNYLQLSHCHFSIVDEEADRSEVVYEYRRDKKLPSVLGVHRISDHLTKEGIKRFKAGKIVVVNNAAENPLLKTSEHKNKHFGFGSLIYLPHLDAGKWKFLLTVGRTEISEWRNDELQLLQELSHKIYIRVQRARAEEALRVSEEQLKKLNASLEQQIEDRTKELKESRYFIEHVSETIPDMISVIEYPSKNNLYVNKEPFAIHGFDTEELSKMSLEEWLKVVHDDDHPALKKYFDSFAGLTDGHVITTEYRAKNNKGEWLWLKARGKVFQRDEKGNVIAVLNVLQNITSQKKAEQEIDNLNTDLLAKNRQLESLNTELKTLNSVAVNSYTETLRHVYINLENIVTTDARHLSNSSRANLRRAQAATQKMKLLSTDITNYLQLYDIKFRGEPIDLKRTLEEVKEKMHKKIEDSNTTIIAENLPLISADRELLTKLMINIIDNSIKFKKADIDPELRITYSHITASDTKEETRPGTPYTRITFTDNGIGLNDNGDIIFELFTQLDEGKHRGSGIGLAICKKIMDMHGGFIKAESEKEKGTSIHCYFPS